ncbi:hypothetical protein Dimus_010115 [Dionaea muscipula]
MSRHMVTWMTMVFSFGLPFVNKKGEEPKRRKDDDVNAPEGQAEKEDERNKDDFDWEAVIDEATVEGESGSGEKFFDAEDEAQGSPDLHDEIPKNSSTKFKLHRRKSGTRRVDLRVPLA